MVGAEAEGTDLIFCGAVHGGHLLNVGYGFSIAPRKDRGKRQGIVHCKIPVFVIKFRQTSGSGKGRYVL